MYHLDPVVAKNSRLRQRDVPFAVYSIAEGRSWARLRELFNYERDFAGFVEYVDERGVIAALF